MDSFQIKLNYGNHPCGQRFCRKCRVPMIPPAYVGDFWDCANCGKTVKPSLSDINKMKKGVDK